MKIKNVIYVSMLALVFIALSCIEEGKNEIEGAGTSFVKLRASDSTSVAVYDAVPAVNNLIEIRRYPKNEADLNKSVSVNVAIDNSLVDWWNAHKIETDEDEFSPMQAANLSLVSSQITFAPGELVKQVKVNFNPSGLDFGLRYGVGLLVTSPTSDFVLGNGQAAALIAVTPKNKYDGTYIATGSMVDYANAALTGPYPWNVQLVTNGAAQVLLLDLDYTEDIYHKILNGGASSYYGSFGLVINFDAENKVTSVVNLYGQPAANGRSAELDPSGVNTWDPVTKTLKVKYWMNQPSVITPHRVLFDEIFTYKGPR
jgi:hypothetical protein